MAAVDYSEVSIVRRLHRGGEGQYLINGAHVRRTDVVELLADVGLGSAMASIISQGRVEAILASKPQERRELVEEAAGLGRFKRRRHRAELKLGRVATQVERARDVEAEVAKRLRPLALQATAAERAEKLGVEIASLRAGVAAIDVGASAAAIENARGRRGGLAAERGEVERRLEELLVERVQAEDALADAAGGREGAAASSTGCAARPSGSASAVRRQRRCSKGSARLPRRSTTGPSSAPGWPRPAPRRSSARSSSGRGSRPRRVRLPRRAPRWRSRRSRSSRAASGPWPRLLARRSSPRRRKTGCDCWSRPAGAGSATSPFSSGRAGSSRSTGSTSSSRTRCSPRRGRPSPSTATTTTPSAACFPSPATPPRPCCSSSRPSAGSCSKRPPT